MGRRRLGTALIGLALSLCGCTDGGRPTVTGADPGTPAATGFSGYSLSAAAKRLGRRTGLDLPAMVGRAGVRVAGLLPGTTGTVYFDVDADKAVPRLGMGGHTTSSGRTVFVYFDPRATDLAAKARAWLSPLLAHELDHSLRFSEGPGRPGSLVEEMISEGIADAFAHAAFPAAEAFPWDHGLTVAQERSLWRRVQPFLRRSGPPRALSKWMFGGDGVPRWTGYQIGFRIVTAYLDAHPEVTAADLTLVDAEEILEDSGYSP